MAEEYVCGVVRAFSIVVLNRRFHPARAIHADSQLERAGSVLPASRSASRPPADRAGIRRTASFGSAAGPCAAAGRVAVVADGNAVPCVVGTAGPCAAGVVGTRFAVPCTGVQLSHLLLVRVKMLLVRIVSGPSMHHRRHRRLMSTN